MATTRQQHNIGMRLINAIQNNLKVKVTLIIKYLFTLPNRTRIRLINYTDPDLGANPIHWALNSRNVEYINPLVQAGVDINKQDNKGRTPLYIAVSLNIENVLPLLRKAGTDINIPNHKGMTPLNLALKKGFSSILKTLLKWGAEPTPINCASASTFTHANGNISALIDLEHSTRQYGEILNKNAIILFFRSLLLNKKLTVLYIFWEKIRHRETLYYILNILKNNRTLCEIRLLHSTTCPSLKPLLDKINFITQRNARASHINQIQKTLLVTTIKSHLDDIRDAFLFPRDSLRAWHAILSEEEPTRQMIDFFMEIGIWSSILDIRNILKHPYPQNRSVGDPTATGIGNPNEELPDVYIVEDFLARMEMQQVSEVVVEDFPIVSIENEEHLASNDGIVNGVVHYWSDGFGSTVCTEPQGILSLSSKDDKKTPAITKEAVNKLIHDLVEGEIANLSVACQEPVPEIIKALNIVPQNDYKTFIKNYPHLNRDEKCFYFSKALFETPHALLQSIRHFHNRPRVANSFINENFLFTFFLIKLNDLCFNNTMPLHPNGETIYTWDFYFEGKQKSINTPSMQAYLRVLLQQAGFSIDNVTQNNPNNGLPSPVLYAYGVLNESGTFGDSNNLTLNNNFTKVFPQSR